MIGRAYIGLVVVGLGVVWLLDQLGAVDGGDTIGRWWPLALIGLGVVQIASDRSSLAGSVPVVAAGMLLLGVTTGATGDIPLGILGPVVLIGAGVWFLTGRPAFRRPDAGPRITKVTALRSGRVVSRSDAFEGGNVTVVLGGTTVDLEDATPLPHGAHLHATVVLGGLDVIVPPQWRVEVRGLPLMGFWDDTRRRTDEAAGSPFLVIHAVVVLGGVEVKQRSRWG